MTSRNNRNNTAVMVADAWDQKAMVKLLKGIEKRTRNKVKMKEERYGRERVEDAVVLAKETYDRQTIQGREERAYLKKEMKRQQRIQEVEWRAARAEGKAKDRMKARARATRAAQAHNELKQELDFRMAQEREHLHYLPQEEELLHRKKMPLGGGSYAAAVSGGVLLSHPPPSAAGAASLFAPSAMGGHRGGRGGRGASADAGGSYARNYGGGGGGGMHMTHPPGRGGADLSRHGTANSSAYSRNTQSNRYAQLYSSQPAAHTSPSPDQHGPHAHFNPNGHYDAHGRYIDHTTTHRSDGMRYSDMHTHQYKHHGNGRYVEVEHHVPRRRGGGASPTQNPPRPHYTAQKLVSPPKPGFASSSSRGLTLPEARRKASGKSRPLQHIEYSHTPADVA